MIGQILTNVGDKEKSSYKIDAATDRFCYKNDIVLFS